LKVLEKYTEDVIASSQIYGYTPLPHEIYRTKLTRGLLYEKIVKDYCYLNNREINEYSFDEFLVEHVGTPEPLDEIVRVIGSDIDGFYNRALSSLLESKQKTILAREFVPKIPLKITSMDK